MYSALPSVLHARYFLGALAYNVKKSVIYQDNKSSIALEKNGKASSSKCTKHINLSYFFIKDIINWVGVLVEHCPTKEMWANVLTKPKQGHEFFVMQLKLLGCPVMMDGVNPVADEKTWGWKNKTTSATLRDISNTDLVTSYSHKHSRHGCVGQNTNVKGTVRSVPSVQCARTVIVPSCYAILCMWRDKHML
jgi:hypothetical protein